MRVWLGILGLLLLGGCAPDPGEGAHSLDAMELRLGRAGSPPPWPEATWQRVPLPDTWDLGRRARAIEGWYRAALAPSVVPDEAAVYVPAFSGHLTLYWNDVRIGDSGPYRDNDTRHVRGPLLVEVPEAARRAGEEILLLRFRGTEAVTDYLRPPVVGPRDSLAVVFQGKRVWGLYVPMAFAIAGLLLAGLLLTVHAGDEMTPYVGWLAAGVAASAAAAIGMRVSVDFLPTRVAEALRPALFHLAIPCFAMALHRVHGWSAPRFERWMLGIWAAFAVVALAVPPLLVFGVAVVWLVPTSLVAVHVVAQAARAAWGMEPLRALGLLVPLLLAGVFLTHDAHGLAGGSFLVGQPLGIYVPGMITLSVFALHLASSRTALGEARALNRELDARVEEERAALERSYDRLRAVEREQAVQSERERMLRDMHDGLGSQLVSTLAMVESGKFEAGDLAEALRDTLDDLRLTVHSVDPTDGDLLAMLAVVRERIEPRLARQGLRFEWNVEDVPSPDLDAAGLMHVLRIVQEVLSNVVKHADARTITLDTGSRRDAAGPFVFLSIRDDGQGLPSDPRGGRGLSNMRERAEAIGGSLSVEADPGGGTRVTLKLPLP